MRRCLHRLWALPMGALAVCASVALPAQDSRTRLEVLSRPADRGNVPEKRFAPYELPFRLPKRLRANMEYTSVAFYAVVVRRERDAGCDGGEFTARMETFRRQAQQYFPERKVFADHQCPDMGAVSYMVNGKANGHAMVAVYAGKTAQEAQSVLLKSRALYPKATVKRMQVRFSRIMQ